MFTLYFFIIFWKLTWVGIQFLDPPLAALILHIVLQFRHIFDYTTKCTRVLPSLPISPFLYKFFSTNLFWHIVLWIDFQRSGWRNLELLCTCANPHLSCDIKRVGVCGGAVEMQWESPLQCVRFPHLFSFPTTVYSPSRLLRSLCLSFHTPFPQLTRRVEHETHFVFLSLLSHYRWWKTIRCSVAFYVTFIALWNPPFHWDIRCCIPDFDNFYYIFDVFHGKFYYLSDTLSLLVPLNNSGELEEHQLLLHA